MIPRTSLSSLPAIALAAVLATGVVLAASPLYARDCEAIESMEPPRMLKIMRDLGLSVEEEVHEAGTSIVWKYNARRGRILFMSDGEALQFYYGLTGTKANSDDVNTWNSDFRYSRSYLDSDKDPVLELDLDFAGGICRERVDDWLRTCMASWDRWVQNMRNK
ncbi:MAG: YbjN domain-containing protein [Deltaproteobacteria bacterium]|jgi:hypothetical protein|nr:YbjN domain-containing protein [Deltaproteobacteria bacterium]